MLKSNEGNVDRLIRNVFGVLSLFLGIFILKDTISIIFIILGFVGLITGLTGFCGLYALLGINTKSKDKKIK
ncbi:MAG: DUF2892 domain-containing protein [Endomicrobiia bacterium]